MFSIQVLISEYTRTSSEKTQTGAFHVLQKFVPLMGNWAVQVNLGGQPEFDCCENLLLQADSSDRESSRDDSSFQRAAKKSSAFFQNLKKIGWTMDLSQLQLA